MHLALKPGFTNKSKKWAKINAGFKSQTLESISEDAKADQEAMRYQNI